MLTCAQCGKVVGDGNELRQHVSSAHGSGLGPGVQTVPNPV